jgi:hypothetical protein
VRNLTRRKNLKKPVVLTTNTINKIMENTMRLIAEDIIEGVLIELYPYGKLKETIDDIVNDMTKKLKDKSEVESKTVELEHTLGQRYGLLVISPKKISKKRKPREKNAR